MKCFASIVLLAMVALCSSCGGQKEKHEKEFMRDVLEERSHLADLERDFCSTNITVAENGLLRHRQWLLELMSGGQTNNHNLFQTDARLFQLYEFKGETNKAETFYQEGVHAYEGYLRTQHRLEAPISREELRARLAHQQQGQSVGWKVAGEKTK